MTDPTTTTTSSPRTALDRINPATRVVAALLLSVPLVLTLDWVSATVALVLELLTATACRFGLLRLVRSLLPLLLVVPLGALSMAFYGKVSGHVWWHWGPITVSDGSLHLALAGCLRAFALALPAVVLFRDVDATRMADGLSQVLRLPSRFVLGTLAGFRMIGLFQADWRTLGHARRARGLGDSGRLRRWALMSFSLLVLALRRGGRLATAMEAKGFGAPTERTWARESRVGWPDAVAVAACVAIGALAIGAAVHLHTFLAVWS